MKRILRLVTVSAIALNAIAASAQTAIWTNAVTAEWNDPANWNLDFVGGVNLVPAEGTNASIGTQAFVTVDYNVPMAATSIASLTVENGSTLNINAGGFNINNGLGSALVTANGTVNVGPSGFLSASNGSTVNVNAGGAFTVNGTAVIQTGLNPPVSVVAGARLEVNTGGTLAITDSGRITMPTDSSITLNGGTLIMTNNGVDISGINQGANGNNAGAGITNNGGTIILDQRLETRGRFSRFIMNGGTLRLGAGTNGIFESSNDAERQWLINGGTADLGDFWVTRTAPAPGAGFVISNGVVNATSMRIGTAASRAFTAIYGGTLTNTGAFTIGDRINAATGGERRVQFLIRGGSIVSTSPEGVILVSQANAAAGGGANVLGSILDINAGSLTAEKLTLNRDNTLTNAHSTLLLSGSGNITLGSGGLVANIGPINSSATINMSGGTIAAKDDFSINANMNITGNNPTFQAADAGGTPFNITHNGTLSSSGSLNKTGGGILTLNGTNTYTGSTVIDAGTLALGATGSINNSAQVVIRSGATFDASAPGGYTLAAGRTMSGDGTVVGNVNALSGATINAGSSVGKLTFANDLIEAGVSHTFELSATTNDTIQVVGTLDVSGVNPILVTAVDGSIPAGTYTLFQYGTLVGSIANFTVNGAPGFLTNDVVAKTISLVTTGVRAATTVTWVGSPSTPDLWDTVASTNWLNGAVTDFFVSGDDALFTDVGGANPVVTVVTPGVVPSSVTVDSGTNYTFTGAGNITGAGTSLTKANSGTLTILTTNSYTGPTVLGGGWLEASTIRNSGTASSIGAAAISPANLQFNGGGLRYIGTANSSSDRGATFTSTAPIDIATANTVSFSGAMVGDGSLVKSGVGNLTLSGVNTYAGETTVSNGVLQINGSGSSTAALGTNAVNLAGGTLFLNVGGQPTYNFTMNLLAPSAINIAANNTIFIASAWTGTDVLNINVTNGGFFTFNSEYPNFAGTFDLGNSSGIFRFNSGGNSSGAQQSTGSSNVVFDLGTGSVALINRNGGGASFGNYFLGALAGGPNTQLRGSENAGSPSFYHIGDRNLDTTFAGSIRNGHAGQSTPQAAAVVNIFKVGTGTLTLSGTNTYTGETVISNGVLALSGFGTIENSSVIYVPTNTVLAVADRVDGTLTLNSNQTLRGSGTVLGSITADSGSTLIVGDQDSIPGVLTITNALVLGEGSTLNIDLDHSLIFGGLTNDLIDGLSSVTYGGTLNLTVNSIDPASVFKLFNANSYSGAFASIVPPVPPLFPTKYGWDTSFLTVDGTLRLTLLRPTITSVTISGADLVIDASNGIVGAEVHVLTSTNVALPVALWTPIATNVINNFDFQLILPNEFDAAAPQRFYRLDVIVP